MKVLHAGVALQEGLFFQNPLAVNIGLVGPIEESCHTGVYSDVFFISQCNHQSPDCLLEFNL